MNENVNKNENNNDLPTLTRSSLPSCLSAVLFASTGGIPAINTRSSWPVYPSTDSDATTTATSTSSSPTSTTGQQHTSAKVLSTLSYSDSPTSTLSNAGAISANEQLVRNAFNAGIAVANGKLSGSSYYEAIGAMGMGASAAPTTSISSDMHSNQTIHVPHLPTQDPSLSNDSFLGPSLLSRIGIVDFDTGISGISNCNTFTEVDTGLGVDTTGLL